MDGLDSTFLGLETNFILRRLNMTEVEAEKVFSIFTGLLDSIQTSVFQVSGFNGATERLIFRKTFPTHYAMCSWPLDKITGFFPYSLALENQALGCRHSIGTT